MLVGIVVLNVRGHFCVGKDEPEDDFRGMGQVETRGVSAANGRDGRM
jgi:hypothetical protein